jgi:hypothetical protein
MFNSEQVLRREPAELLGDWHPLVSQLGSTEGLVEFNALAQLLRVGPVDHETSLRSFLDRYLQALLLPVELPAIQRAFNHAAGNELRELIAFDREQSLDPLLRDFSSASRRVGQDALAVRSTGVVAT